jgi:hypothetical protein
VALDYGTAIYNIIGNDATVLSIVSTWGTPTKPSIFDVKGIPSDRKEHPIINYYRIDPINGGVEIDSSVYSINNRAQSEEDANALGVAVYDALRRVNTSKNGYDYFFIPSILGTLLPQDETDMFNVPVDVIIKARPQ